MKQTKYIITGSHQIDKNKIAADLQNRSAVMNVCGIFSSNPRYEENEDVLYLDSLEINNGYKNNAFLYIKEDEENNYYGVTIEEFEKFNVIPMELEDFNGISQHILEMNDVLVIWVDSSSREDMKYLKLDIKETKYLMERLQYTKYLYFLNESNDSIVDIIIKYHFSDEEDKQRIIEENM